MPVLSSLTARIRRISLDEGTPANYTLVSTSSYDEALPADTQAAWGTGDADVAAMDQALSVPVPPALAITHQGVLIEFEREPFRFDGVAVKIRPTYDSLAGEDPAFELWTQQQGSNVYTLRRRIPFASLVGVPSGRWKIYDLSNFGLSAPLANVTRVWVVMNPGTVGTPTLEFAMVHVFGRCRLRSTSDGRCYDTPDTDCLGDDDDGPTDPLDCEDYAPEVCDIPPFDWPKTPPADGGPTPKFEPPEFPTVDLCDADALEAFKAELTPDQLTYFEELLAQSELPCLDPDTRSPDPVAPINADPDDPTLAPILPRQPVEIYMDPTTGRPGNDPRGNGAGGLTPHYATPISRHVFFFFDEEDRADFAGGYTSTESPEIQAAWEDPTKLVVIFGNGAGPYNGGYVAGGGYVMNALDQVVFTLHGVNEGDLVQVEAMSGGSSLGVFGAPHSPRLSGYASNMGHTAISAATIVDWLIERTNGLAAIPDSTPEAGGDGSLLSQSKSIVPRGSAPVLTLVSAYDPTAHLSPAFAVSTSDEDSHVVGGNTEHKHLGIGLDELGPPGDNVAVQTRHFLHYFKITVTKQDNNFDPLRVTSEGVVVSSARVAVTVEHTTVTA